MSANRAAAMSAVATLLPKLDDPDPDIRFMQLNDLANVLNQPASEYLRTDGHASGKIVDRLIKTLTDTNGEVQSQALKCVGSLATRIPNDYIAPYLDKTIELVDKANDISVPITAVRLVVTALPRPSTSANDRDIRDAYSGISRVLLPRLVGYIPKDKKSVGLGLLQQQKDKSYSADAVEVAIEVVRCFGTLLQDDELTALVSAAMEVLGSTQASGVVKKRALVELSVIAQYLKTQQLDHLVTQIAQTLQNNNISVSHRRYLISTIGSIVRTIPAKIVTHLDALVSPVLDVLSEEEMDLAQHGSDEETELDPEAEELKEAALVTLDNLLLSCTGDMQQHWSDSVAAALRYVKYDPNVIDDDEEMGGTQEEGSDDGVTEDPMDDDDEYAELDDDDAFGDVEDLSWKVRRCAAKVLFTLIVNSPITDHQELFTKVSAVLLSRLSTEREESVKVEIMAAITALVQRTTLAAALEIGSTTTTTNDASNSSNPHKRKRVDSFESDDADLRGLVQHRSSPPFVPPAAPTGHHADLAVLIPKIVQATVKLWKKASISLKQAAVSMLKAIAASRNGALADHLQQLEDMLADALKSSSGNSSTGASGSTATAASLQIETLSLISSLAETNGSSVLTPFVVALIPSVTNAVNDRNYKVAGAALASIEYFAKALSPPRAATSEDQSIHIQKLYDTTLGPVNDINADLEVRHRAVHVFGVLIARTSGTNLLSPEARTKGLGVLDDRLKNETMRLETVKAVGLIAEAATAKDALGSAWVQEVSIEMANQLRKSDRILRASCLEALQYFALNTVTSSQYSTESITSLQTQLLPLLRADDINLLTPALVILAKIIPTNAQALANAPVVEALCKLSESRLEGPPLKAYLLVVKVIGEQKFGQPLMSGLLAVGTNGDMHVLGRAIGTLMVFGGDHLGVSINAFIGEVNNKDESSACLALTALGEVGLRLGSTSPVPMNVFTRSLSSRTDKTRLAAAIALGSASSSNVQQYLPGIIAGLNTPGKEYLYLHALKEILQHSEGQDTSIIAQAPQLWKILFSVASVEDNAAVGAECIGRLVLLDPETYLQALSQALDTTNVAARGTVVAAFRFTLSDNTPTYNAALNRTIVPLLEKMLSDDDLGNKRLAVTTLTAAIQTKQLLILPSLNQLLPSILASTHIDKSLIKVVKIGPFTHYEDAGLDLRKAAYATLYTLVESPAAVLYLNTPSIFDRVQDGISDDQDVRTLCNLMLSRLSEIDPDETKRRLPSLAEQFKKVLEIKPKENAVKQEIEKIQEGYAAVIRTSLELSKKFPQASSSADSEMAPWKAYIEYMKRDHSVIVKSIDSD